MARERSTDARGRPRRGAGARIRLPVLLVVDVAGAAALIERETSFDEQLDDTDRVGESHFTLAFLGEPDHRRVPAEEHVRVLGVEFDPEFVTDEALTEIQLVTGSDFTALLTAPRSGVVVPATTTTTAPPVSVTPESTIGVVPGPTPAGTACE